MNVKPFFPGLTTLVCAGVWLGAARPSGANTLITFQVDMTMQVQSGTFNPASDQVYARGSFNNWGTFQLTNNPTSTNPNLYTGTVDDTSDTNGGQLQYKFYTDALGWENTLNGPGDNRATLLPATNGASLVLPVQFFSDAGSPTVNLATFRVDMSQQIALGTFDPSNDTVEVQGDFEGWTSGYTLTNDPTLRVTNATSGLVTSNVYVGTYDLAGSPGQVNEFKFVIQPGSHYELPDSLHGIGQDYNRFAFNVPDQTLPIVFFSDQPLVAVVANRFTFSVDMSVEAWSGILSNKQVRLSGPFDNWDTSGIYTLTNDPNAANSNLYSVTVAMTNGVGVSVPFKFGFVNGDWEINPVHTYPGNPTVLSGNNRSFTTPNVNGADLALPTVYFNDISPNSVLPVPTLVTFTVNMTNAVGTEGYTFRPSQDSVYLNGMVLTNGGPSLNNDVPGYAFAPWTNSPSTNDLLSSYLMTNNPVGSELYTLQLMIPAGYPVRMEYQYSINGNADEATNFVNHIRYIRSTGSYLVPLDKFGSMTPQEQSFGNLAIGPKSGNGVSLTWLGRPGVYLQVNTNLTGGMWLTLPTTEGGTATNYPVTAGTEFFRLVNPF